GDPPHRPHVHLTAEHARFSADSGWTIGSGFLRRYTGPESESTWRFRTARVRGFDDEPEKLLAIPREPEEMRYAELGEFIEAQRRSGGNPLELMVEQAQKIAIPCATLIIVLFGMPLANAAARGSAAYGIGIALGSTSVSRRFCGVAGAAGARGAVNPGRGAWSRRLVFLVGAGFLWAGVRTWGFACGPGVGGHGPWAHGAD